MTRAEKQKEWENIVNRYRNSNESVSRWCTDNNVKPERLWYWLRKHKTDKDTDKTTALVQSNQWLPIEVYEHLAMEPSDGITVKVGKASIEVKPGFEPMLLSQVVRVLTASC
jgi:hypothetical protein